MLVSPPLSNSTELVMSLAEVAENVLLVPKTKLTAAGLLSKAEANRILLQIAGIRSENVRHAAVPYPGSTPVMQVVLDGEQLITILVRYTGPGTNYRSKEMGPKLVISFAQHIAAVEPGATAPSMTSNIPVTSSSTGPTQQQHSVDAWVQSFLQPNYAVSPMQSVFLSLSLFFTTALTMTASSTMLVPGASEELTSVPTSAVLVPAAPARAMPATLPEALRAAREELQRESSRTIPRAGKK